ncbi:hypothetical protein GYMLUDRAFT_37694 [Collybiopsis luxurians FD-317 M1]|nr:hypothetical protein GYMLUDRAFT_37694 [Collybiopsis luxurians FD-317 M1]
MSAHLEFEAKNGSYAQTFDKGHLSLPPSKQLLVVTCMDARIDVYKALGLELGEAHVVRNAGGVVRDAIRSILLSQRLLGTREIAVIHHTDCGMLTFTAPDVRKIVKSAAESQPANEQETTGKAVDNIDFFEFNDLEKSVKDDVKFLQENLLVLSETKVTGWIFDVKTGKVRQVA